MEEIPLSVRIEQLRAKELAGTLTTEEMREAIRIIRAGRVSASESGAKAKASAAPIDTGAVLAALKSRGA